MSINSVVLVGNLTRDAQLRSTPSGTAVMSVGMAVNDRRKNKMTGEWEDYPNFIDGVMYGKRAESLSPMLHKGMKVSTHGKLHYSSWQAEDGTKRSKVEVVFDEIEFMSQRGQDSQQDAQQQQYQQPAYSAPQQRGGYQQQSQQQQTQAFAPQPPTMDMYGSDLPF